MMSLSARSYASDIAGNCKKARDDDVIVRKSNYKISAEIDEQDRDDTEWKRD